MSDSTNRKARSRERILKSAVELFSRQGFEKVSIGQIMKLAKMTHGAFYAHFASKEALYHASVRDTLESSRAARLVKGPLSVKHLTELVSNCWNLQELERKHQPGPETVLFNEIGNENAEIRTLFEASYLRMKKMLETRLIALSRLKKLPFDVIADKSRVILASLVGAVALAKSLPGEQERQHILEAAQRNILQMLGVDQDELDSMLGDVSQ
ncbi:TetR family transcriptional regulator [Chromohalobacter marismortui]|uniref:TetR family transcriptional regulator n=1 Tax=Chromohalobacter marismortui TaxID=42055 RepID=A0A4R7NHN2_9GAMM|nr:MULTISPECIES: TetR/AcrR family transcriptional regulator [Chromohalobacter]MCI0510950.1 TetR/AcrR family transcriptional regulator [Chromohalobacter sp.]MCI0562086.1 TetR/AcrR family transcriptional regulator [Nitrososphaera sp.]TDU20114.1 TetR family transcriptional regulator [Chromohalobacter marismortui]